MTKNTTSSSKIIRCSTFKAKTLLTTMTIIALLAINQTHCQEIQRCEGQRNPLNKINFSFFSSQALDYEPLERDKFIFNKNGDYQRLLIAEP